MDAPRTLLTKDQLDAAGLPGFAWSYHDKVRFQEPDEPQFEMCHLFADVLAPMYQNEVYTLTARTRSIKTSSLIMDGAELIS